MVEIPQVARTAANAYTATLSIEEKNAALLLAAAPLITAGFRAAIFDATVAATAGLPYASFIKQVKFASSVATAEILHEAIEDGIRAYVLRTPAASTCQQFYQWCKWMKTPAGRSALSTILQNKKLSKRLHGGISVTCYRQVLQQYEAGARAAINREERALKNDLEFIATKYLPVAEYSEPDKMDVYNLAYELYSADAVSKGKNPIIRVAGGLEKAMASHGANARQILVRNHAKQEKYRPAILNFMAQQFLSFRDSADIK